MRPFWPPHRTTNVPSVMPGDHRESRHLRAFYRPKRFAKLDIFEQKSNCIARSHSPVKGITNHWNRYLSFPIKIYDSVKLVYRPHFLYFCRRLQSDWRVHKYQYIKIIMHTLLVAIAALLSLAPISDKDQKPAGKESYIDVMQQCVESYDDSLIISYIEQVEKEGITEHGFARLTSNIGILLANGRIPQKQQLFKRMMDICAREIPVALKKSSRGSAGNDFSIKEICCCLHELEKSGIFDAATMQNWKKDLSSMKAKDIYNVQPEVPSKRAYNWCVYGSASECARIMTGIGGDRAYADKYFSDQLRYFDENGMYKDPHQPIVYDIVTRLQFMAALDFGYDGPAREQIEEQLLKSALPTLWMQSVTGEIPYGGRSNQFLHNDSFYAAVFEYYATWMKKRGDMALASRFKAAAQRSMQSLNYWLSQEPVRHIKNHYPTDSGYGCERYAYFNKYMVTTGSWAYLAWRFADDTIIPSTKPEAPTTFVTSPAFHQIIMNAGGYTVQFDTDAYKSYDSNGIGRIQKQGAPSVLAISVPCPAKKKPKYKVDITSGALALAPLWEKYIVESAEAGKVVLTDGAGSRWTSQLSKRGLKMKFHQKGEIKVSIPAFKFDGESETDIKCDGKTLEIRYKGWCCRYTTDGRFVDTGLTYANRNGHLCRFDAVGTNKLKVNCQIFKL